MATSPSDITTITPNLRTPSNKPAATLPDTQSLKRKLDDKENREGNLYSHFSTKQKRRISQSAQWQALEQSQAQPPTPSPEWEALKQAQKKQLQEWDDIEKQLQQEKKAPSLNQKKQPAQSQPLQQTLHRSQHQVQQAALKLEIDLVEWKRGLQNIENEQQQQQKRLEELHARVSVLFDCQFFSPAVSPATGQNVESTTASLKTNDTTIRNSK